MVLESLYEKLNLQPIHLLHYELERNTWEHSKYNLPHALNKTQTNCQTRNTELNRTHRSHLRGYPEHNKHSASDVKRNNADRFHEMR